MRNKSTRTMLCRQCGTEFKPKCSTACFCSTACADVGRAQRRRDHVAAYMAREYEKHGSWRDSGPKAVELKAWMMRLKAEPCCDCGKSFPACCMDFDHRMGCVKQYNVGSMFAHHYSRGLIEMEIAKCDLVCANCHRIRTQKRRLGSGSGGRGNIHAA